MVAFFLSLQDKLLSKGDIEGKTSRVLQSVNEVSGADAVRILWYLVVGIVCVSRLAKTFLQVHGLVRRSIW